MVRPKGRMFTEQFPPLRLTRRQKLFIEVVATKQETSSANAARCIITAGMNSMCSMNTDLREKLAKAEDES